jgi:hypothetical protein
MCQDGSGCIGVVATRVKQDTWLVLNTDLIYHMKVHAVIFPHLFAWLRVQQFQSRKKPMVLVINAASFQMIWKFLMNLI